MATRKDSGARGQMRAILGHSNASGNLSAGKRVPGRGGWGKGLRRVGKSFLSKFIHVLV